MEIIIRLSSPTSWSIFAFKVIVFFYITKLHQQYLIQIQYNTHST